MVLLVSVDVCGKEERVVVGGLEVREIEVGRTKTVTRDKSYHQRNLLISEWLTFAITPEHYFQPCLDMYSTYRGCYLS